jgi:hypothetical protein
MSYNSSNKFEQIRLVKLKPSRLGLLRRCDRIARDRDLDFDNDIRRAFNKSQEVNHAQLRSDIPSSGQHNLENYQSRTTTIRANLWNARIS